MRHRLLKNDFEKKVGRDTEGGREGGAEKRDIAPTRAWSNFWERLAPAVVWTSPQRGDSDGGRDGGTEKRAPTLYESRPPLAGLKNRSQEREVKGPRAFLSARNGSLWQPP